MSIDSSSASASSAVQEMLKPRDTSPINTGNTAPVSDQNSDSGSQLAAETNSSAMSVDKLQEAMDQMNDLMMGGNRSLNFSVDDNNGDVVVKVVDTQTDEVVRQIPTEETQRFAQYLEGVVGLIFDKEA